MVVEYKPSHKLSVFNVRGWALRADERSMNIPEDVNNQIIIPPTPKTGLCTTLFERSRLAFSSFLK
jgi:hypothetical protein